jgi:DNA-binding beta-propeller fold protein YncE
MTNKRLRVDGEIFDNFMLRQRKSLPVCNKYLLLTVVLVMIASCGGGNSQPAATPIPPPAAFDLIFPGEASLTDASQITVVGSTETNRVSSVTIKSGANDIVATLDTDGRWRANAVPLQPGANSLVAELTETDGEVTERTIAIVQSSPILSRPSGVLFDAVSNRVFVADAKQLLAFDLATEMLEVISSAQIGTGPKFNFAQHLALAGDGAILVADFRRVQRVDPTTGDRTDHVEFPGGAPLITSIARDQQLNRLFMLGFLRDLYVADLDAAPPILAMTVRPPPTFGIVPGGPTDSAYVAGTDSIYIVEPSTLGVSAINGASGELEFLMLDTGGVPVTPTVGIDYDEVEGRLLVLGLSGTLFSLDPITGSSGVLIPAPSTVSSPKAINGLSQGNEKLWTVSPVASELISIDVTTGNQTVEVDSRVGGGAPPGFMLAGRYDASANRIVAVSDLRLIAIDAATGSRQLLANLFDPMLLGQPTQQPSFSFVSGMALSQDGTRVWLTDLTGILAEVNVDNGEIREVSGPNTGSGPLPDQIAGIAVNAAETVAYVGDRFARRIFRVDLVTGQRDVLPEFAANLDRTEIRTLVLDADANRLILYIAPSTPAAVGPAIYAVDLASFELTLVADLTEVLSPFDTISAPGFPTNQMSLSADGSSLFFAVSGNPDIPYVRIDLALGALVRLGDASSGPPFFVPNAIEATQDGRLFALDGTSALYVIDAQTGERAIVSK